MAVDFTCARLSTVIEFVRTENSKRRVGRLASVICLLDPGDGFIDGFRGDTLGDVQEIRNRLDTEPGRCSTGWVKANTARTTIADRSRDAILN